MEISLRDEDLQVIENDQAEDERLTRLALSPDLEGFHVTMRVVEAQTVVRDAEIALERAQAAAGEAIAIQTAYTARIAKETRIASHVNGMQESCMANELISIVLKTAIKDENIRWRATRHASLDAAVDDFFAWPPGVHEDHREVLRWEAGPMLLRNAIVELPARFTMGNGTARQVARDVASQDIQAKKSGSTSVMPWMAFPAVAKSCTSVKSLVIGSSWLIMEDVVVMGSSWPLGRIARFSTQVMGSYWWIILACPAVILVAAATLKTHRATKRASRQRIMAAEVGC